jgi:hypothetical protein
MEDGLSKSHAPVTTISGSYSKNIYDGYLKIKETKKRGEPSIKDQVAERFEIEDWEWPRLKVFYEAALDGDETAIDLVRKVDGGQLKISQAYEEYKQELQERAAAADLPKTINLPEVYDQVLRSVGFARNKALQLRRGAPINTSGMSDKDIADLVRELRTAARYYREIGGKISHLVGGTE